MKYFAWLIGLPLGSIVFIWVSGLLLGQHYQVSAAILVEAPPEAIWKVLEEVENYPKWRRDIASVEVTELKPDRVWWENDFTGRRSKFCNRGSVYPNKWMSIQEVGIESLSLIRTLHILQMETGGTQIAVTEEGGIRSPFTRFWRRFQTGYAIHLDQFMKDLFKRLGQG